MKQLKLNLNEGAHGGPRVGAGRKRLHSKGVAHRTRETVSRRLPLHVNFKYKAHVRNKTTLRILKKAIRNARLKGLRILQFSLQSNHVHFIIEADNNTILESGMRSLTVTMAINLRKGKVQIERYHLHVLRSLRETRNAVHYVLFNQQKHEKGTSSVIDEYSSLLGMKDALMRIRRFAEKKKMCLWVSRGETWEGDRGMSFLYLRSLRV